MDEWSIEDFEEQEVKININTELLKSIAKDVYKGTEFDICAPLLALKIALQVFDNCIYVISNSIDVDINENVLFVDKNAISYAIGVAKSTERKVICIADYKDTSANLGKIISCKENIIYICLNSSPELLNFAEMVRGYSATASIAYPEDYINKLKKVFSLNGFRFLDVLCPDNKEWGFEPSDTVHIADIAVKTKLWPLIEKEKNKVKVTKVPDKFEPVERLFELAPVFKEPDTETIQKQVDKKWRKMVFK